MRLSLFYTLRNQKFRPFKARYLRSYDSLRGAVIYLKKVLSFLVTEVLILRGSVGRQLAICDMVRRLKFALPEDFTDVITSHALTLGFGGLAVLFAAFFFHSAQAIGQTAQPIERTVHLHKPAKARRNVRVHDA
jgi:hypothetical protein